VKGDAANELISFVADPNVSIQESKALTGNIEPGRKSTGRRVVTSGRPIEEEVDQTSRDKAPAGDRPTGGHGIEAGQSQEGEQT
jgi:formate dehydrogenase major subunit